jgi:hypothetical protein
MSEATPPVLEQWRWDERVFPHRPVCPEHAEQDRLARAERIASLDPATAAPDAVGLMPLSAVLDKLREEHPRPFEVQCHHSTCDHTLADSIDVEWDALAAPGDQNLV